VKETLQLTQEARPPYLLSASFHHGQIEQIVAIVLSFGLECRVLDGRKMNDADSLFTEFAAALSFPDYFGRNWEALDECLADLSWVPAMGYVLLITDSSEVLVGSSREWEILVDTLVRVAEEWAEPVDLGEPWDRPKVPFHTIFHDRPENEMALKNRLSKFKSQMADLRL
jgi:RNAse (barnase) inhibitor barstar